MFLLIPLILILASAGGIFFIVWRKLPEIKKLAGSEVAANGFSIKKDWHRVVYDLCPEVVDWVRNIKIDEYKETWFVETEKLLRRLRVASLKMDRFSDSLIKKIREKTSSDDGFTYAANSSEGEERNGKSKPSSESRENAKEELRRAEQKLILEIAKNPKNASLYEELGDLYLKMGDYQDSKESYEAAIELNSNSEELNKKLSQILEKLHKSKVSQN